MDVNAGRILDGSATVSEVADEIVAAAHSAIGGQLTISEQLGHQEFVLTYKSFEPSGPSCHPLTIGR
jgi:altronate dehydratase large subunit